MLGQEFERIVDGLVARYPQPKAAMLPVLWEVQRRRGWIDLDAERWVAQRLGVEPAHVHGVVTFYTMFHPKPVGKYHFQVCSTLSCMLRGAEDVVAHLERRLGVKPGEVSADGRYSLVKVECLGSCGTAPMFQLNDDFYEDLTIEKIDRLIDALP